MAYSEQEARLIAENKQLQSELASAKGLIEGFQGAVEELKAELAAANAEVEQGRRFKEWVVEAWPNSLIGLVSAGRKDPPRWIADWDARDLAQHGDKPKGGRDGE